MKKIFVIFVLYFLCLDLFAQNKIFPPIYDYLKKVPTDTIGSYSLNVIVIGVVELDSLMHICYVKSESSHKNTPTDRSFGELVTFKYNIPLVKKSHNQLNELIYRSDFFDYETDYNIIRYFIYPQCNEFEKSCLEQTFERGTSDKLFFHYGQNDWQDVYQQKYIKISYKDIPDKNRYLLVLMNRTWRRSCIFEQTSPPIESDTSNTYIKYLIPLF